MSKTEGFVWGFDQYGSSTYTYESHQSRSAGCHGERSDSSLWSAGTAWTSRLSIGDMGRRNPFWYVYSIQQHNRTNHRLFSLFIQFLLLLLFLLKDNCHLTYTVLTQCLDVIESRPDLLHIQTLPEPTAAAPRPWSPNSESQSTHQIHPFHAIQPFGSNTGHNCKNSIPKPKANYPNL